MSSEHFLLAPRTKSQTILSFSDELWFFIEFQKCHKQLETWIGKHFVPNPEQELTFRHGTLDKIWLGGLVNPAALITSLKHEKAASCECSIEDVSMIIYL
jgi:hypothetical protein